MDGADSLFFGTEAADRVEQLGTLRRQRMKLAALRDEVDVARRMFTRAAGGDGLVSWRSAAARGYAATRLDVTADLGVTALLLSDALDSIERAIAQLKALL